MVTAALVKYNLFFMYLLTNSRSPEVKYSKKMAEKTKTYVLDVKMEDPASNKGIIAIYKVRTFFWKNSIQGQRICPHLSHTT